MKKIAITGSICSGKTFVVKIFEEFGIKTIISDDIIADIYHKTNVINWIQTNFPECIVDNKVDKKLLGDIVFNNEEEMARRAASAAEEAERLAQLEAERAAAGEAVDEGDDTDDSLTKMRESMKKEKKKPTIPAELLAGNSYEDKLMIVRLVTEQEQNRVANAIRSMIQIQP
jgi:dephospho-CoA kinase